MPSCQLGPISSLPTTGRPPTLKFSVAADPPRDVGDGTRHTTQHLTIEVLHDFRATLLPPHLRTRDLVAVLERQRVGRFG